MPVHRRSLLRARRATALSTALACLGFLLACARAPVGGSADAAKATLQPRALGEIERVHAVGSAWLASQPSAADLELAKAEGFRTIVNLRPASEHPEFDEEAFVEALGLRYVSIPVAGATGLTDDAIDRAREALNEADRPLLMHCSSANRVGAAYLAWRVLDGGVSLEDALAEAKTIGMRSPELEASARAYIEARTSAR